MKFKSLQIKNFKGFQDSGTVEVGPRFNVIVGQNNAGKTALLEAFKLQSNINQPYKQKGNTDESELPPDSWFIPNITIYIEEIIKSTIKSGGLFAPEQTNAGEFVNALNNFKTGDFEIQITPGMKFNINKSPLPYAQPINSTWIVVNYDRDNKKFPYPPARSGASEYMHKELFYNIQSDSIYFLNSQRFSIGKCQVSESHLLSPTAQNLPSALNHLQGSHPQKFGRIVQNLKQVFPSVGNVTVTPIIGGTEAEILIWPYDDCDNVKEATPLDKCGTGISQALSILFIASQEEEKVIVIDEIGSFLHPTAIKNLIRILKSQYSRHQYIISTHHTDVISWSEPDKIILVQKINNECKAINISLKEVADFELMAGELGVSMADVFGSDQIIWVEGETEEQCFPLLMEHNGRALPKGTNFAKIIGTGNLSLKNRNVDMAFDVYNKISKMASPLTRACIFTMDRETMSDADVKQLKERAQDRLLVLDRRCYENYLIHPEALASLLAIDQSGITTERIRAWLSAKGGEEQYGAAREWADDIGTPSWLIKVDGAKLLNDLFGELTEERYTYQKTTHSPQLTQKLLQTDPDALKDLLAFAEEIFTRVDRCN